VWGGFSRPGVEDRRPGITAGESDHLSAPSEKDGWKLCF